jgi:hypothetical protein
MKIRKTRKAFSALALATLTALSGGPTIPAQAASHREAPLIALDPAADITDFYTFRSWEDSSKVVFIMNVIPGQEPSSGPNYFNFADDVLYAINIDTNKDGVAEDVVYEFRFTTEIRGVTNQLGLPVANAAVPPVTKLNGPGSEGLGLRQSYTVTEVRGRDRRELGNSPMFAVPSNMGSRTMPNYEALANQGIYPLNNQVRVFAGQRDETFYIDLGATFDTLNLRRTPPVLSNAEDANDTVNPFGIDHFSGFNVNTIAIEVPINQLTGDPNAIIGAYASTSRSRATVRGRNDGPTRNKGPFVRVARLANPLVNELIIGTVRKDEWNATAPETEASFIDFYRNPRLATVMNLLFGTNFPTANRTDLLNGLLKYPSQPQTGDCTQASPCSELLRLNLAVPPTSPEQQKRLGPLARNAAGTPTPDFAGWPNGRRPNDDVTDVALRLVAGLLVAATVPNLSDGVNFNIGAPGTNLTANRIAKNFPFLPTPFDGRDRRHIDSGEP